MLNIGILIIFHLLHSSRCDYYESLCAHAAYCQMVYGDVERIAKYSTAAIQYEKGVSLLKRHFKFIDCGIKQMEKNCAVDLERCESDVKWTLENILSIPDYLIRNCNAETIPYTLLLCKHMEFWPKTPDVPEKFKKCKRACGPLMIEYDNWHKSEGKSKKDFPPKWDTYIENQKYYIGLAEKDKLIPYPEPTIVKHLENNEVKYREVDEYGNEVETIKKTIIETKRPQLKQNKPIQTFRFKEWNLISYLEGNPVPSFGEYTSTVDTLCPPSTYINAIAHELPERFMAHCQHPNIDYKWNEKNVLYDKGYRPTHEMNTCIGDHTPVHGSFVVGIKFIIRRVYVENSEERLSYLQDAGIFCSGIGLSKLRPLDPKTEEHSKDFICPTLTAMCSLQFQRYKFKNGTSFLTNIKFGCCSMPEDLYYSSIASVKIERPATTKGYGAPLVLTNSTFDTSIRKAYCPPGYFIDRFDVSRWYTYLVRGMGVEDSVISVVQFLLFCNNFEKNDQKLLEPTLYDYLNLKDEKYPHGYLSENNCNNCFFTGGSIEIEEHVESGSIGRVETVRYTMIRSDTKTFQSSRADNLVYNIRWKIHIFDHYKHKGEDSYVYKCPDNYAICGLHYTQSYKYVKPTFHHVSMHGPLFYFICCPMPVFLSSRDCGSEGITVDLEKTSNCNGVQGADITCKVQHSVGYSSTHNTYRQSNPSNTVTILKQFGKTKYQLLTSIVKSPFRKIGKLAQKYTSNITFEENSRNIRSRSVRELSAAVSIIIAAIGGALPDILTAVADRIPKPSQPAEPFKNVGFEHSVTISSHNTTTKQFVILKGQRLFSFDVFLKCGPFRIYSDDPIKYIPPTLNCQVKGLLQYIGEFIGANELGSVDRTFHFRGYGLFVNETPRYGLAKELNWVHISSLIKEKFEMSPGLYILDGNGDMQHPFANTDNELWGRYNAGANFSVNVTIAKKEVCVLYRVIAACGDYFLFSNKVVNLHGLEDKVDIGLAPDKEPKPVSPFLPGLT